MGASRAYTRASQRADGEAEIICDRKAVNGGLRLVAADHGAIVGHG
jgi:hypothetical protein